MKKLLTLVAAAFMAVGVNAQTEDVIKVSSGNSDWGQMFVDDGVAFEWPGRTFESTDKLTAKALYAGSNLKDSEGNDLTYARESGTVQTYTIEFGAIPTVNLQICVNCIIPNQYGGGNSTMKFKPLTIVGNKASFTVSKEDCSYTGWSYKKDDGTGKWIQDKEYKNVPQDVTSIVLQACDDQATYPAVINIKSIKRVTTTAIPSYTFDLANVNYAVSDTPPVDGWCDKGFFPVVQNGACHIAHGETTNAWEAQVNFANVYPKGATIKLSMTVSGAQRGSISAELQNPNGLKFTNNYVSCGSFPDINLTTSDQEVEVSTMCTGDGATRLLLNLGKYPTTIYIKSVKIEALEVPQETVTISPSGYSTYAAYYPVDYSKLGLEAYAVKLNADTKTITTTKIKEGVVPAGKAVLLKGTPGKSYELTLAEGPVTQFETDLQVSEGSATSTTGTAVYGLATVNGQDGFYKAVGKTIPAKCAYLEIEDNGNSAKFYSLGDHSGSTTGITSVKNEAAGNNAPMYNLAGQLVDKGYKGIVIKNGKKIVLK